MSIWFKINWWKILIFCIIIVFIIPLGINHAFKSDWGIEYLKAEWSADAAITFYGAIVAALIAVYYVNIAQYHM